MSPCELQAQGTPGGAAAKEVARLSLHRVRDLQLQLSEAEERAAAANKSSAQLTERLADAEAKLAAAHKEAAAQAEQAAELSAALAALEERAAAEEQGRQAASTQVTVSPLQWVGRQPAAQLPNQYLLLAPYVCCDSFNSFHFSLCPPFAAEGA